MKTKKRKITTLEKYQIAKSGMASGKYKSIEEASKAAGLSAASYYIYDKKRPENGPKGRLSDAEIASMSQAVKVSEKEPFDLVRSMQLRIEKLEKTIVDLVLSKTI